MNHPLDADTRIRGLSMKKSKKKITNKERLRRTIQSQRAVHLIQ